MKQLAIFLLIVALLTGGALLAVRHYMPMERIKQEAVALVKEKTGRDFSFGEARVILFPNIGVRLKDVRLSNPEGMKGDMATLGMLDVRLALKPLLQKRVEVARFVLQDPVVRLEKAANGKVNWEFGKAAEKEKKAPSGDAAAAAAVLPPGIGFKFGELQIAGGKVTYADRAAGKSHEISALDITIGFPDLNGPLQADGTMNYRAKRVSVVLNLGAPLRMAVEGKTSSGSLRVKAPDVDATLKGVFALKGENFSGDIETKISSLAGLVAWLGEGAAGKPPFETVSFFSKASASATSLALKGAALKLDDIETRGDVTLGLSGKPDIVARLSLNKIDLDRFMPALPAGTPTSAKPSAGGEEWDAAPMDMSGLKAVNVDVTLQTQGFSLKGAEVGPSLLAVALKDGRLKASSSEASLFGGKFLSALTADATSAVPVFGFRFKMDGVQAQPVLKTFAKFDKLSGAAEAMVDVTSTGSSQKEIIGNLAGSGAVVFKDGSLTGIDLVNIAKLIQQRLDTMGVGAGKTDFVELGGTFTVKGGVAHNADLRMKGPLVQASGAGDIDLPQKKVKYRVIPVLTASSAVEGASGLSVPVDIHGPFSAIKVNPDFKSVIQQAVSNPENVKQTIKGVKEQGKALEGTLKQLKKDPVRALEGLLGGGLLGGAPTAAPAPAPVAP